MHQIQIPRSVGGQAVDRLQQLLRVKLRRRSGRQDECALGRVHFAIRQAKSVAGENAGMLKIDDGVVMHGVAGVCTNSKGLPQDSLRSRSFVTSTRSLGNGTISPVEPPIDRLAIHVDRGCNQLRRIDEMHRAARMQTARALGSACMRAPARRRDPDAHGSGRQVDGRALDAELFERCQQIRH